MQNPPITQPVHPVRLRQGCRANPLIVFFVAVFTPLFLCGLVLLLYLVFPPAPVDILILGLDSRSGEGAAGRTDSLMLLGVKPSQLRVSMLSIPRDLFIDVPNYGSQRVNTVNVLGEQERQGGGVELLSASLEQNFGVGVDRYLRLDFSTFVELVNAVGGVMVDVERSIVDYAYPTEDGGVMEVRFDSGYQYMDGERALQYARTRHSDDDYARARRQQQVLSAVLARLANPARWPAVIDVLNRRLDTNLTFGDMMLLAPPVLLNLGRFERLVIDRDYLVGSAEGGAVPNYEVILPWVDERFD